MSQYTYEQELNGKRDAPVKEEKEPSFEEANGQRCFKILPFS
jgi:hypothetical protein